MKKLSPQVLANSQEHIPSFFWDIFGNRWLTEESYFYQLIAETNPEKLNEIATCIGNKTNCWYLIAFSHPEFNESDLKAIGKALGFGENELIEYLSYYYLLQGDFDKAFLYINQYASFGGRARQAKKNIVNRASEWGRLDILKYLETNINDSDFNKIINTENYDAILSAIRKGQPNIIGYFENKLTKQQFKTYLQQNDYFMLFEASISASIETLEYLVEIVGKEFLQDIIKAKNYHIFSHAAWLGRIDVLTYCVENIEPSFLDKMIEAPKPKANRVYSGSLRGPVEVEKYPAFREAIKGNKLNVIKYLEEITKLETFQDMLKDSDYKMFEVAVGTDNFEMVKFLEGKADDKLKMIGAGKNRAFHCAVGKRNKEMINHFLSFSGVFEYAERHYHEYKQYVVPYLEKRILELREKAREKEREGSNAVFDLDEDTAGFFYYALRNLIRQNDPERHDDIIFLLDIPGVKTRAHANGNELLRLAFNLNNQDASSLLLRIPEVRILAEQNQYYEGELRAGASLSDLTRDKESSMTALTRGEQQRLNDITLRYEPFLKALGVSNCMDDLRDTLISKYQEKPAFLQRENKSGIIEFIPLPVEWEEFQALNLSEEERKKANEAYYQNACHTALRYLSKPNLWLHENASYVYINPDNPNERWSTFDEYESLISLFYLAAQDEMALPTDDYTIETRIEHFIEELALIGRAHNWDDQREIQAADGTITFEEYDNLEGDRPSCYSGVKRRLFQSVQGHPLLKFLTNDLLKDHLREFIRIHFQKAIQEVSREDLNEILRKNLIAEDLSEEDRILLKKLDISSNMQEDFLENLSKKYGGQVLDRSYRNEMAKEFRLHENQCHLFKFMYFLGGIIDSPQDNNRFFSDRMISNNAEKEHPEKRNFNEPK